MAWAWARSDKTWESSWGLLVDGDGKERKTATKEVPEHDNVKQKFAIFRGTLGYPPPTEGTLRGIKPLKPG